MINEISNPKDSEGHGDKIGRKFYFIFLPIEFLFFTEDGTGGQLVNWTAWDLCGEFSVCPLLIKQMENTDFTVNYIAILNFLFHCP